MMNKYSFSVHWSDEDGEYVATCPEFPGLSAYGESTDEAIAEAQIALKGMIQVYREKNIPLPAPRKEEQYSGQFRVRIPKTLHRQVVELAKSENVSLNTFVTVAIALRVGSENAVATAARNFHHRQLRLFWWGGGGLSAIDQFLTRPPFPIDPLSTITTSEDAISSRLIM